MTLGPRIRDHRERQERLEAAEAEARAALSQRRKVLEQVETIADYAHDLHRVLLKKILVTLDNALMHYTILIAQSTRKAPLLMGDGSEELRIGEANGAYEQVGLAA